MTLPPLTPAALKRLQIREREQRRQSVKDRVKAIFVDVGAKWVEQEGRCNCDRWRHPNGCGGLPMNPDMPGNHPDGIVIAHAISRKSKAKGEHTPENVWLWRHSCNQVMAGTENHDQGVANKMMVDMGLKVSPDPFLEEKPKRKSFWPTGKKIQGRGFDKTLRKKMNGKTEKIL
jgi:5-methylcytosine-specific restriction endonuclease McrA